MFCAHANLASQIADLQLPDYVEVCRSRWRPDRLQPLFAQAAVFVTDYSSVAFEIAYLEKPVVYYQFDAESFFAGGHTSQTGYFDYQRDGYGPVAATEEDLLARLEATLDGSVASQYAERGARPFPIETENVAIACTGAFSPGCATKKRSGLARGKAIPENH